MKKTTLNSLFTLALITTLPILGGSSLLTACSTAPKVESTGQYIDSSVITTKVKSQLLADKRVKGLPITVKTYKNVVQLSGFVDTEEQSIRAQQIAQNVEGVAEVRNGLLIKKR